MREERKFVTVLFADLAGFTSRSEALDPEDVRAFLVPYYDVLTAEIERHGGLVDRFLGDGVMALFGAPLAHEDDPERAVRAALRILERIPSLGLDLHLRLGINTGEVLYAAATGERDDSVTGDAVNTAARLQAAAPVDAVVVGEATYRATAHLFRYEALPPITAKGKAEPVPLWRPLGPIAGPAPVLGEERTPFVGRTFELETLVRLYERARATSSLEIVTIVAGPGMGKSRLVRELARHVDALPELVTWRVGRCLPYGDAGGFSALSDIVKAHAGIRDTDNQVTLSAKLEAVLTEADPSLRTWIKDRIGPLAGLAVTAAPPLQEEAFTAWRRFLEGIAERGPTVLVVEDLHWAGEAMIAFLEHLAGRTADLPLLLVATARPEAGDPHQGWLGRTGSSRTTLRMDALDHEAMAQLLGAALPGADAALTETVLARAGGSPLFAEQLAAMLREASGQALEASAIPLSIQALLAARIDALPAEAKALLLDASVIGRRFSSDALIAVSGRDGTAVGGLLMDLARREMVRSVIPAGSDEDPYAFVHALVRDVAYAALPRSARLTRHRAVAAWITERKAGHLGPDAEQVVAHLADALELAAATHTPAVESAAIEAALVTSLLAAADHGMRTQPARTLRHLRRALELVVADDPRRPDILARLGRAHLAVLDHAAALPVLEEAAEAYRERGDSIAAAELAVSLGAAVFNVGDAQREAAIVDEARRVLEEHPGPGLVAVLAEQAHIAIQRQHDSDAIARADGAIDLARELGLPPPHAALHARGVSRLHFDLDGGEADLRLAIERAEAEGDLRAAAGAFINLAGALSDVSGTAAGIRAANEAIAFCAAHGMPTGAAKVRRAQVLFAAGAWDEAFTEAEAGRAWGTEHRDAWVVTMAEQVINRVHVDRDERTGPLIGFYSRFLAMGFPSTGAAWVVADAALAESERETALSVLQDAIDRSSPGELVEPAGFVRACLRAGSARLAQQALSLGIGQRPSLANEVISAEALIAEADGDLPAARDGFASAAVAFARFGNVPEHAHAVAGLGRCLLALGETEEGIARLRESRAIWERLRAAPRIAEIDALLAVAAG